MKNYSFSDFRSLTGPTLTLRAVTREDLPKLASHLLSPTTWFSVTRNINSVENFISYFEPMLDRQAKSESLTIVAIHNETSEMLATSTYQYPSQGFKRVEIGFTWIADQWQRTFVNSELKYLMLEHAFEDMRVVRVEFSVHPNNQKSNAAMKRLGATLEGTLRKWRFLSGADDGNRNIYSIIDDEWPDIKARLLQARVRT